MDRFSSLTVATLERMMGGVGPLAPAVAPMIGRLLVPVEGPESLVEELIADALENDSQVRRANRKIARRDPMEIGVDTKGQYTINGRTCCWEHVQHLQAALERLPMLSEHKCPGCKSIYRVDLGRVA